MRYPQTLKYARPSAQDGVSLVEIMIVVVIMALLAAGVGVAVMPQFKRAKINTTKTRAQAIYNGYVIWSADNPGKCPSPQDLVDSQALQKGKDVTDAWGQDFSIKCDGNDAQVTSAGPDGQFGTEDDIS